MVAVMRLCGERLEVFIHKLSMVVCKQLFQRSAVVIKRIGRDDKCMVAGRVLEQVFNREQSRIH